MAKTLTITAPDEVFDGAAQAFCRQYGRPATVPNPEKPEESIDNPESETDFATRMILRFIREVVVADSVKTAETTVSNARDAANTAMDQAAATIETSVK